MDHLKKLFLDEEELLKLFAHINFKEEMANYFNSRLKNFSETLQFKKGEKILSLGEKNKSLYILLSGELEINLQDEHIAHLYQKGEIIGEMSIITQQNCHADVIAKVDCTLLKIRMDQIKVEAPKEEQIIYKFLCLCLSQKLENTNVKAKQFEILNRTLQDEVDKRTYELKVQNSELSLSFKKLENMHSESLILINKLASLDDELIKNTLLFFEGQSIEENRAGIQNGLKLIQKNLSLIKTLKKEQDTIEGRNVLVAEPNTKLRNLMKIALGGTGVKVEIAKTIDEVKAILTSQSISILFLSANMLEVADFVAQEKINLKIVLLTEEESKNYISKIKNYSFLSNIITTNEDDRNSNIKSISTTVKKMTTGDIFGLEKYLNWGVEVKEIDFTDSAERNNINEKVLSILSDVGIKNSIRTRAQIVIEELLMNAIYDAPVDQQGTPLHNHKSRRERVILEDYQKGKLRFATDGLYLAISVEDPFGVFKKETIFQYLEGNYSGKERPELDAAGKGGAGKGLYLITENSDLVIYNVAPQTKTEVIVLFELDNQKDKRATSLHYFEM